MHKNDDSLPKKPLTGQKLRATAFALLAKREYSKNDLIKKLLSFNASLEEVDALALELEQSHYQSDQRMAGMLVRSQVRQGRGPERIKQALKKHQIETELASEDLQQIDWFEEALVLKIRKFGEEIVSDPKIKARQIRFLQYRGFSMDIILKVVHHQISDE